MQTKVDPKEALRALNAWAVNHGYADFDTYVRTGGSFGDAVAAINKERHQLALAMAALYQWTPSPQKPDPAGHAEHEDYERANQRMSIGEEALARAEAEACGEPVDPHNAHAQGDDHVDA